MVEFNAPGLGGAGAAQPDHWSSVPFFGEYATDPSVRLLVEWYDERQNSWSILGYLPPQAGDATLLRNWARWGTFRLAVVDNEGRSMGNPRSITIDKDHAVLQAIRSEAAGGLSPAHGGSILPGSAPSGGVGLSLAEIPDAIQKLTQPMMSEIDRERQRLAEERADLLRREARVHDERTGATGIMENRIGEAMGKVVDMQAKQSEQSVQQVSGAFGQILAMQMQAAEREREREAARASAEMERLRTETSLAIERERLRLEQEKMRMEREEAARKDAREREDRREADQRAMQMAFLERMVGSDKQAFERELERTQAHGRAVLALAEAKSDPLASITTVAGTVLKLADSFGIDVKGMLGGMGSAAAAGGTAKAIAEAFAEVVKVVAPVIRESLDGMDDGAEDDEEIEDDRVPVDMPGGVRIMLDREEYAKLEALRAGQPAIAGPVAVPAPTPVAVEEPPYTVPGGTIVASPAPPPPPPPPPPAPMPAGMSVEQVREIRAKVRELVGTLEALDESTWAPTIVATVPGVPGMLDYLQVVTVAGALKEAAVDQALAQRVLAACVRSGLPEPMVGVLS